MARIVDDKAGLEEEVQRLDRWLWFSRVLKSRTLAAQLVVDGKVRVNRARVTKPSQSVRAGDVLTIAIRGKVHVLRILAAGHRRGPPAEARGLYQVVEAPATGVPPAQPVPAEQGRGATRRSKRGRRLHEDA